jgi:deferrochelatase/peroxidase EfeB
VNKKLELADIQGNVLRAYGRFGYPAARYVCLNVKNEIRGRDFIAAVTERVTTAIDWSTEDGKKLKPNWTANIAFSYQGLRKLGLPRASLVEFSPEFSQGMKARKDILGDQGPSAPENWDPVWERNGKDFESNVHILITLNGLMPAPVTEDANGMQEAREASLEHREQAYEWLLEVVKEHDDGVAVLGGHCGANGEKFDYQDADVLFEDGMPTAKEHFGYHDGISDPVIEGVPYDEGRVEGRGKLLEGGKWAPLATGEFLFGHIDEAHEYPPAPRPILLSRNGTYMVFRKLHENVGTFNAFLSEHGKKYPGGEELLAAKFVGRWKDGTPLVLAPNEEKRKAFQDKLKEASLEEQERMLSDFSYEDDMSGAKCPFSAHMRRINPRGSLEQVAGEVPGSMIRSMKGENEGAFDTPGALANRRRIMRRGLPYGTVSDRTSDKGNHGIVIMMLNANINRQFEFVQQQWINYGNDFKAANDKEILLGNHNIDGKSPSKAVIQVDPESDDVPYIVSDIPLLVETRGGDYFFVPSMTALRLIARGVIDPT